MERGERERKRKREQEEKKGRQSILIGEQTSGGVREARLQ